MKFFRTLALALAVVGTALSSSAMAQTKSKLQQILERGTIRVGTTGDFNPMSVRDPATNSYKGFDIDAMQQLAKDLGVRIEWVPAEWATLVAGITADRYDIFSGASLSMARAKTVAFSAPYLEAGTVPLMLRSNAANVRGWADLNKRGVTIAVLMGTVFEEQARAHFPQATIRAIEKPATGFQEVLAGRATATITSNIEAGTLVQTYPNLTLVQGAELRNKRPFAFPMPQNDHVWINYVNNWVALKHSEGFFDQLETKWLGK